jgi:hypothetical protein
MSVGYIPYVTSAFRMWKRNICAVLTETIATSVNPGSGNLVDFEIQYRMCNSEVNPAMSIELPLLAVGHTQVPQ